MSKSIQEINKEFQDADKAERKALIEKYSSDDRKGVQKIIEKHIKEEKKLSLELERLDKMKFFEKKYDNNKYIVGIDEAGRGPLAGPVVAGAVILPKDCEILYLNDSKKVSATKRELLYKEITQKAVAYGVGIVSPERIDEINILQATYEAMREAVANMKIKPDMALVDAVTIPDLGCKQVGIIKGDAKSVSIAAASIIAKVTRDHIMIEMDKIYPQYGFASNKGYGGAKIHIDALKEYGPCPIHRRTFISNFI